MKVSGKGKVILYNPREKTRLKIPYIPFSLLTVAGALKRAGFEVKLIDARIEEEPHGKLLSELSPQVLFVGITLITGSVIDDALIAGRLVKKKYPDLKVVAGGVHASLLPRETVAHPLIDIVILGAGERTAVELARRLQKNEIWQKLNGLAFCNEGEICIHPRDASSEAQEFGQIDYGLIDLVPYIKKDATGNRCLDYLSSRGCPHPCTYCAISKLWKKKIYYYSAEKMVAEIQEWIARYRVDSIRFLDDNFFVDRKRVERFCDEILARNIKVRFWSMCRIQYFALFDDAFLRKLKQAGFVTLNFGAESGSQKILDRIKKGIRVEQILETARRSHGIGFRAQFSFMMAFPFEDKKDLEQTMGLIDQIFAIDPHFDIQLFPYTPFPQTDLANECMDYGFRYPESLEAWARFEYGGIRMPWLSETMRGKIDILTTLAWFAFTSETAIKLGGWKGWAFRRMASVARWRWRHRCFLFPWEWRFINKIAKRN